MADTDWTREWIRPEDPKKGDWLMWKRNDQAIYTAFPDGERVDPETIGLDFTCGFQVNGVVMEKCWRKMKDDKTWVVELYVAVQFDWREQNYYTTFSRSDSRWLHFLEDLDETDRRKPTWE